MNTGPREAPYLDFLLDGSAPRLTPGACSTEA